MFENKPGKSVKYEYYLPTSKSSNKPQKAEYHYVEGEWTKCSKTCAKGMTYLFACCWCCFFYKSVTVSCLLNTSRSTFFCIDHLIILRPSHFQLSLF